MKSFDENQGEYIILTVTEAVSESEAAKALGIIKRGESDILRLPGNKEVGVIFDEVVRADAAADIYLSDTVIAACSNIHQSTIFTS